MEFTKIECTHAFYDEYWGTAFYVFDTIPEIGHGEWAISEGGDVVYDLLYDRVVQNYPAELSCLVDHIPDDIEIEGLEE
ncbi:MAG: hypothetical protein ACRCWQ_04425 [Bacilli bacterium]